MGHIHVKINTERLQKKASFCPTYSGTKGRFFLFRCPVQCLSLIVRFTPFTLTGGTINFYILGGRVQCTTYTAPRKQELAPKCYQLGPIQCSGKLVFTSILYRFI